MAPLRIIGILSCLLILISFFLNWAWYPDIQKYFTAFFTEGNYYGKPGKVLSFVAISGLALYWLNKPWGQRINLIFSALGIAFAIRTYLLFTSGYDGYVPEAKAGLYLMLLGSLGHLVASMGGLTMVKTMVEKERGLPEAGQGQ